MPGWVGVAPTKPGLLTRAVCEGVRLNVDAATDIVTGLAGAVTTGLEGTLKLTGGTTTTGGEVAIDTGADVPRGVSENMPEIAPVVSCVPVIVPLKLLTPLGVTGDTPATPGGVTPITEVADGETATTVDGGTRDVPAAVTRGGGNAPSVSAGAPMTETVGGAAGGEPADVVMTAVVEVPGGAQSMLMLTTPVGVIDLTVAQSVRSCLWGRWFPCGRSR